MLKNYIVIALRSITRNRLYSAINIGGLAVALVVYLLSQIIADHERTFDTFFQDADRVYAISADFQPGSDVGVSATSAVPMVVGPLLREQMPEAELIARMYTREVLTRSGDNKFYQGIRFVEPEFIDIFAFDYIRGEAASALADPSGLIITETAAKKYFGDTNPMGGVLTMGAGHDLQVTAVIADLPLNSHFTSGIIMDAKLEMLAHIEALEPVTGTDPAGSWGSISFGEVTYVKLRDGVSLAQANSQLGIFFDNHVPEDNKELLARMYLTPLQGMNSFIWEMTGLPMLTGIEVLGIMVLIVACLNYVNLATAQVIRRTREVGVRKTMGASRAQLFGQFLTESILVATISLVVAAAIVDMLIPLINDAANKNISFNYVSDAGMALHMVVLVLVVGLLSGAYPAFLIARANSLKMLNGTFTSGRSSTWMRSTMLVFQFSISVFMMGMVAIIYLQNGVVTSSSEIFAKDRIVVITRLAQEGVRDSRETLRTELSRIDGVEAVSFGNQAAFEMSTSSTRISTQPGDEAGAVTTRLLNIDDAFLDVYDIPLLAGRFLSRDIANDVYLLDEDDEPLHEVANIVVNEMALVQFGWSEPAEALGKSVYNFRRERSSVEFRIVGVIPDVNFLGFHNKLKPYIYRMYPEGHGVAAVKVAGGRIPETVAAIEETWERIVPAFPIQKHFLQEDFEDVYNIFRGINVALSIFAVVALTLAGVGLFGLSAYMAERRTREIGIRKVMGATVGGIVRLLVWQFSKPVVLAVVIGGLLSLGASYFYLDFFANRISLNPVLFLGVGLVALAFAAFTVAGHALRVARANPVHALRCE